MRMLAFIYISVFESHIYYCSLQLAASQLGRFPSFFYIWYTPKRIYFPIFVKYVCSIETISFLVKILYIQFQFIAFKYNFLYFENGKCRKTDRHWILELFYIFFKNAVLQLFWYLFNNLIEFKDVKLQGDLKSSYRILFEA